MKVLWVTNSIIGALAEKHGIKQTSGQWLNAELDNEKIKNENEIVVCTSGLSSETYTDGNISYIVLSHGNVLSYAVTEEYIADWKRIITEVAPDVILVWGTEYDLGRCALVANEKRIPSVIYIQGVMSSIAENYRGGLSDTTIKSFTTLVERLRKRTVFDFERMQKAKAEHEKECIMLCDAIISENDWSISQYKKMRAGIKIFRNRLPIKSEFFAYEWKDECCRKHRLVTTSASYPLKGLHKLLEAINLLKQEYPDIELCVPGPNTFVVMGWKARLTQSGYCKWLYRYIRKNRLQNNVIFVGPRTTEQYAELMQSSQVFVTASAIENHCSSLREAMSVGVPGISSRVGGIPEYAVDGKNCSLYEFENSAILAAKIKELFEDKNLRETYSTNGKATIKAMYSQSKEFMSVGDICQMLINERTQ